MDSICRLLRSRLWLYCLLCVLSVLIGSGAHASTRKHVSMPTAQSVAGNPSGQVTRTGNSLFVPGQPLEGEFIPGVDGKKIPVRGILPTIDFSIPRTLTQGKNLLKGGVIGAGVSLGIDWMLSQIGAFIDENSGAPMKNGKKSAPASSLYWCHVNSDTHCNNSAPDRMRLSTPTQFPDIYKPWNPNSQLCSVTYSIQNNGGQVLISYVFNNPGQCGVRDGSAQITYYRRGTCPAPSFFDAELMSCVENAPVPLEDPDYDLMFNAANSQNAAWLKGLLKDVCAASPSPARCFEEMKQNSALNGPASVAGGTTTQTTNSVSPSGVSTQTVTTTKNTYSFTYGPTYYDYRKTTQIITTENGEPKSDTTIEDPVEPEQEEKPPEEEQEEPVLCAGQGCDGPAYVDQYEPTDVTKEEAIDSYMSRIQSIPIIAAVSGLFSVNVSGTCPVWEVNSSLDVMGASMPINLRFDYLCLPWVVSLKPWIQAVMLAVCLMLAIRIALL